VVGVYFWEWGLLHFFASIARGEQTM